MAKHPLKTLAANSIAAPAVTELYDWLMSTYLPERYPTMFKIHNNDLRCKVTEESLPSTVSHLLQRSSCSGSEDSHEPDLSALRNISSIIDTEFLILLPSPTQPSSDTPTSHAATIYTLQGFAVCTPSGFNTRSKLGLPLAGIHTPVPGYKAKLEKSMDRYFDRLECDKWVRRANWTIQSHDHLFTPGDDGVGNHLRPGDAIPPEHERKRVDPEECFLRCESQKLFRMPKTRAIVFAFKTYLYPLKDVNAEGREVAESLAEAIDGVEKGAEGIWEYKRGREWGPAVRRYLREGWDEPVAADRSGD